MCKIQLAANKNINYLPLQKKKKKITWAASFVTLGRLQSLYVPTDKMRNVNIFLWGCVQVKITQSCPTLWPHGLYSPWNSPGQNTGVGSLSLFQELFTTQGLNPGLLYCRQILYQLSHKGSPRILEWVACVFSIGFS